MVFIFSESISALDVKKSLAYRCKLTPRVLIQSVKSGEIYGKLGIQNYKYVDPNTLISFRLIEILFFQRVKTEFKTLMHIINDPHLKDDLPACGIMLSIIHPVQGLNYGP